jgi:hypothetical protein
VKQPHNPVRAAALIVVAITSAYVMWMGYRLNETLSGPGWCATALGAGKASTTDGAPVKGLEACVGLLTIQLKSISTNSHILFGVVALCLAVLVVIVIAGGRLSFKATGDSIETDISQATPVTVVNPPEQPIPVDQKP